MRRIGALLIYLTAVFGGGALLAPWVYFLIGPRFPFHRVLDRCLLGIALLGLWPLLKYCGMASWCRLGYVKSKDAPGQIAAGLAVGFVSLGAVMAAALALGAAEFRAGLAAGEWARRLAGAAATAVLVAVAEETLFRGGFFGILREEGRWKRAALASAVIYALAHFLKKTDVASPVTWISGLESLPGMFAPLADAATAAPLFFNLTLVGIILAAACQRTGALYYSIGLHAGWVFWIKLCGFAVRPTAARDWLWGGGEPAAAWAAAPVLGAVLWWVLRMKAKHAND